MASNYPPKKNVAFTYYFFIYKNDGTIIANPTLSGSNVHTDGGAAVTNSTLAVVNSTTGLCSIALAQATMNGDQIDGTITSSSTGAVVHTFKFMTAANTQDEIGTNVAAILADTGTDGVVVAAASKTGYTLSTAGIAAVWDALTSGMSTVGSVGKRIIDYLDAAVSSRSTYAGGDTSGTTTLLSRIVGTLAAGTHTAQSGDAYARLGAPTGASVSADVADMHADIATVTTAVGDVHATDLPALKTVADNILRWFTNKQVVTSASLKLRNDTDTADLYTQTLSYDGTTGTRGAAT